MRKSFYFLIIVVFISCTFKRGADLRQVKWIHGSADCSQNTDDAIQVVKYNVTTWILRQNKCTNYEAPFIYLFIGTEKALLMDTGATHDSVTFPLRREVDKIISNYENETKKKLRLVIAHSHSHGDHYSADNQFRTRPNTEIVSLRPRQMKKYFGFQSWPEQPASVNLGERILTLIAIPGHDEVSIALYDPQTHFLLTGDSFYPGRLYVRDWKAFSNAISRLNDFCKTHNVEWLLGNHIEMKDSAEGFDYPTGATYQPNEAPLPLYPADLNELAAYLSAHQDAPARKVFEKYILEPVPAIAETAIETAAKHELTLQGYPDFLAADGEDVWVTNVNLVQKLSASSPTPTMQATAPGNCGAPVVAFNSLWVASCSTKSVLRIDRATGKIIAAIASGIADVSGELSLAASDNAIWVLSDERGILSRIDPATNKVAAKITVKPNSYCATFGFGSVWITNTNDSSVQRIDPTKNTITSTISVGGIPRFLAVGEGAVWTLNQKAGTVSMIDPNSNEVIETIATNAPGIGGDIATGKGSVWVRAKTNRMLQSIDPLTSKVRKIYTPLNGSGAVRVAGKFVWVTAHDVNKVWVLE